MVSTTGNGPRRRNREGCSACLSGHGGETARTAWGGIARKRAVAEFIRPDEQYRACLEQRDARKAHAHWLKPASEGGMGGRTVVTRVRDMVARGLVDFEDVAYRSLDGLVERGTA